MEPIHSATHSFYAVLMLLFHIFGIFDLGVIADGLIDDMIPACNGASAVSPTLYGQRYRQDNGANFFSAIVINREDLTDIDETIVKDVRELASVLYDFAENLDLGVLLSFVFLHVFDFAFQISAVFF